MISNGVPKDPTKNEVVVQCMPNAIDVPGLLDYLRAHYGVISKYNVITDEIGRHLYLRFLQEKTVKRLLSERVEFNDIELSITSAYCNDENLENDIEDQSNCNDSKFDSEMMFTNQLNNFVNTVALSDTEVMQRNGAILHDLEKVIRPLLHKCKLCSFGSTATGLGLKNADTDIYLNPGKPIVDNTYSPIGPHVARLSDLLSTIEKILRKNSKTFACVKSISGAKVPIIIFKHIPTDASCDLSFTSLLGVHNSKLIKYYLSIDSRFKQLMIIIKYWLQYCGKKSVLSINSYTINLLFIFFLQNIKLVPSVYDLQRQCTKPVLFNNWQINFSEQCPYFHADQNFKEKSVPELLGEFFKFYAHYDFENNLICPLTGKSYCRDIMFDKIPSFLFRYSNYLNYDKDSKLLEIYTAMCVQDPFELNHNVSRIVSKSHVEKFQIFCSIGELIIGESAKDNHINLFSKLLPEMNISNVLSSTDSFSISFDAAEFLENNSVLSSYKDFMCIRQQKWFNYMFDSIIIFFSKVLCLDIVNDHNSYQCFNDEENADNPVISIKCTGKYNLFTDRKIDKFNKKIKNPLEREIQISRTRLMLLSGLDKGDTADDKKIEFRCKAFKRTSPSVHVYLICFNDSCDKKLFRSTLYSALNLRMRSILRLSFKHQSMKKKS